MNSAVQIRAALDRRRGLSALQFSAVATGVALLGLVAILPALGTLWNLWTTDALKSIGMLIPGASLVLILRVWKRLDWTSDGTWWGLPLLLIAIAGAMFQERAVLILYVSHWSTGLPPPSLVLLAYASGVVLLIGGVRLYRMALFPILLLWFANPVPHVFSVFVDLPLQYVSAHFARAFAIKLGYGLTPDHLRLMFTPEFGMFIAPGCNGIRGSLTMGFIALIAGYVYRFRWYMNLAVVAGAVLLGYVFNLARLCLLVLYYGVALHLPSLQGKAERADYLIGAGLFLVGTLLLLSIIRRYGVAEEISGGQADARPTDATSVSAGRRQYVKLAALGGSVLLGCLGIARGYAMYRPATVADAGSYQYPERIGNYRLVRSWNEVLAGGEVVYNWAEYAPATAGGHIAIGVSPILGWHDAIMCHTARGERPLWEGPLTVTTGDGAPVSFSTAFYDDGISQYFEASTQCNGASCGEFTSQRANFGFVFSRPNPSTLFTRNPHRPIPVLIRSEIPDLTVPSDTARGLLTERMKIFLGSVSIDNLTGPYRH